MIPGLLQRLLKIPGLAELEQENRRLREQLEQVRDKHAQHLEEVALIQQQLLPECSGSIEGIQYAASYRPFVNAGGDYYDVVPLPVNRENPEAGTPWGAIIADASGHGPAAAVEVAMLDAILRTYTGFGSGPADVLNYINRHFFTRQIRKDFITAMVINFNPDTGLLGYANAGHHPALIIRGKTRQAEFLNSNPGIPLGITRDYRWGDGVILAETGDTVFLYTDGVTETRAVNGERFGMDRLKSVLRDCQSEPEHMIAQVVVALNEFRGGQTRSDDESMLAIRII